MDPDLIVRLVGGVLFLAMVTVVALCCAHCWANDAAAARRDARRQRDDLEWLRRQR